MKTEKKLSLHQETIRNLTSGQPRDKAAIPFSVLITFCIVCPHTVTNCPPCVE